MDIEDLMVAVRRLRNEKLVREKEIRSLNTLISSKEQYLSQFRQDLSVLLPSDDIRCAAAAADGDDSGLWQLQNSKIEMQVLLPVLRSSLVALEHECKRWESAADAEVKQCNKSKRISSNCPQVATEIFLESSSEQLRANAEQLFDETALMKNSLREQIDSESTVNKGLIAEISNLRRDIQVFSDEREQLRALSTSQQWKSRVDRCRVQTVVHEFVKQRTQLQSLRDGVVWQKFLFDEHSDPSTGLMTFEKAAKVLSKWFVRRKNNAESPLISLSAAEIEIIVRSHKPSKEASRRLENKMCYEEDEEEQEELVVIEEPRDDRDAILRNAHCLVKGIDFQAFCLLVQQLMSEYE